MCLPMALFWMFTTSTARQCFLENRPVIGILLHIKSVDTQVARIHLLLPPSSPRCRGILYVDIDGLKNFTNGTSL